jgi:signal transduction histidine kinase/CheY-like chemotaxis protein
MSPLDAAGRAAVERIFAEDTPGRLLRLADLLDDMAEGGASEEGARLEAHSLLGAAAIAGRSDLVRLCRSILELIDEDPPEPRELRAAAGLVRDAESRFERPRAKQRRFAGRGLPRRFMSQLAVILALTIVPALCISIFDLYDGRRHARDTIVQEVRADAQLAAAAQQQLIDGGRRVLLALSLTPEIRSGDTKSCSTLVRRYAARLFPYYRFGVTASDGRVVCSSVAPPPGYSAATLPLFKTIRRTGRFAVGSLQRDPVGGGWVVIIGQPLEQNQLHGAQLGAVIAASGIQRLIDRARLPGGSSITVFDRRGSILARKPDSARYVGKTVDLATVRALDPSGGTTEASGIDGVSRVFAYAAAGPWYVSVGIPTGPAYAKYTRELVYELVLIGCLGLLGVALGLAGARRAFARPLAILVSTARELGSGDLSARTGIEAKGGELGELAASMDAMAGALEQQTVDRERATANLAKLADELEQRVLDRTAELESAREEAERASHAKTAFLSSLSHELRTPLNAIRGFSQLLRAGRLSPEQADSAAHIASGSEHMTRLVEELLDTARIEAGEFRVELVPFAVVEIVREVVDLSRGLADDHGVSIGVSDVDPTLGVIADRGRLRQALLNVVTNAILYNRRGGSVCVRAAGLPSGRVAVDVVDTGEGIDHKDLARVFAPYDRLGRGPDSGGLGLGLALSKRLVEAMGGTIEVASEPGLGTRFTIELGNAAVPAGEADPQHAAPASERGPRRVLYVEDNATSMKLVELLLRGRGVEFLGASTAVDGIAAARAFKPDLILLDLQLPDGSGEDVLRTLRAEAALRAVPIVMLSAQASRDTIRRLLEAGADDYLTKPLEVDRAADLIERLLRREDT